MGLTPRSRGSIHSLVRAPVQGEARSECAVFSLLRVSLNGGSEVTLCLAFPFHVRFSPTSKSVEVNPGFSFDTTRETWTYRSLAFGSYF